MTPLAIISLAKASVIAKLLTISSSSVTLLLFVSSAILAPFRVIFSEA